MSLLPHQYGNWKPKRSERLKAKKSPADKRKDREGNSSHHLAALRQCPCVVTLKMPAGEVHHLKSGTRERGMALRSSDRWGLPFSRIPHEGVEHVGAKNEMRWFAENGIPEPHELAAALWAVRPSDGSATAIKMAVEAMTRIIVSHHKHLSEGK